MRKLYLLVFLLMMGGWSAQAQQTVTGTLTAAGTAPACLATECLFLPVTSTIGGVAITLSGTWSGTASFYGSGDGGSTLVALNVTPSSSTTPVTTATGNGSWQVNPSGYTGIYVIFTTASSGSVIATMHSATASARASGGGGGGGLSGMTAGQVPIAATATTVTSSAALQGTDAAILTAGTVTGTASALCTDANGGATTTGCSGGSISGMTTGQIPVAGGTTSITSSLATTGTGNVVRVTSPTLVTPVLGAATGTSLNLGATGTLSTTAQSGTGSLCMTANCSMTTPALGTPSAIVLTNATGAPTWNQNTSGNAATATALASVTGYSVYGSGASAGSWLTPTANAQCLMSGASSYATTAPSFQSCPSSGTSALSGITAATGANTIASGNNVSQIWNWAMTTANSTAFTFGETTAATSTGTNYILAAKTLAGSTASPLNAVNSLTGSQTLCTICVTPTWNTTGVVDAAIFLNVTNTASAAGSLLADLQFGGTSEWKVDKAGNETVGASVTVASDGTHSGLASEVGNTTAPASFPSNSTGWLGANSASFTSYFFQPSATAPAAAGVMLVGTAASNVSAVTYSTLSGTGTVIPTTVSPTFTTPNIGAATGTSLLATGLVDGTAPVIVTTGTTGTPGATYNHSYSFNEEATAATAVTYTLPTAAAGKQYCIANAYNGSAANTGALELLTSATGQFIVFTDGTLSATGGYVISGGAAADSACVVGIDATHWFLYVQSGTWTKH